MATHIQQAADEYITVYEESRKLNLNDDGVKNLSSIYPRVSSEFLTYIFVFNNAYTILEDNHDKTTPTNETTCVTTTRTRVQRQTLSGVPVELLLRIADFLPPSSQAILSLVNKTIFQKLGNQFLYLLYNTPRPQPIIEISLRSPVRQDAITKRL
ncbi:hypothetical protein V8E51_016680 [Hyaloscypha variabilis]